jgi:hypothetical protein
MSPEVQTFTVHLWFFQTFLIVQLYNFMIIVHILVSTVYWTELNNDVSNSYYTSDVQARTHDSQSLRVKAQKTQKTSLNHGCIVVLSVHCLFLLSALANHARTAGRTSNCDKTGMLTRTCKWASIVVAFKLQRSSSFRMLYALISLSTSHECGLAARTRARASDIGSHDSFDRLSFSMSCNYEDTIIWSVVN